MVEELEWKTVLTGTNDKTVWIRVGGSCEFKFYIVTAAKEYVPKDIKASNDWSPNRLEAREHNGNLEVRIVGFDGKPFDPFVLGASKDVSIADLLFVINAGIKSSLGKSVYVDASEPSLKRAKAQAALREALASVNAFPIRGGVKPHGAQPTRSPPNPRTPAQSPQPPAPR